jgi:hypothetical protein
VKWWNGLVFWVTPENLGRLPLHPLALNVFSESESILIPQTRDTSSSVWRQENCYFCQRDNHRFTAVLRPVLPCTRSRIVYSTEADSTGRLHISFEEGGDTVTARLIRAPGFAIRPVANATRFRPRNPKLIAPPSTPNLVHEIRLRFSSLAFGWQHHYCRSVLTPLCIWQTPPQLLLCFCHIYHGNFKFLIN